jgi:hypothetical protein
VQSGEWNAPRQGSTSGQSIGSFNVLYLKSNFPKISMKFALPVGCLLAGIAIGWLAKPTTSSSSTSGVAAITTPRASSSTTAAAPERTKSETAKKRESASRTRPAINTSKREIDVQLEKQLEEQAAQQMTDIQRKKFQARFAKLCTELNLTPDQQLRIRASMEERFAKMVGLFTFDGEGENAEKMASLTALMESYGVDETTAALLTDEQKSGFEAIQVRERQSRIDSTALKDLGTLGAVLELSQDQRDSVYGVLSELAAKQEDVRKSSGMMNMFTEGRRVRSDDELGISDIMNERMEAHGDMPPHADFKKFMADTVKQRAAERVEALRPVLNEQQLEQYRAHLETEIASIMNLYDVEVSEEVAVPAE